MLSALLTPRSPLSFGQAPLKAQPEELRRHAPLPEPGGELAVDPDFVLPTSAGRLPWHLFYSSDRAANADFWGFGWRASWPSRLTAGTTAGTDWADVEREDGTVISYVDLGSGL